MSKNNGIIKGIVKTSVMVGDTIELLDLPIELIVNLPYWRQVEVEYTGKMQAFYGSGNYQFIQLEAGGEIFEYKTVCR